MNCWHISIQVNLTHFLIFALIYYRFDALHVNRYGVLMFHKPAWSCGLSSDGGSREDVDVTPESSVCGGCVINCRDTDGCEQRSRQLI